MRKNTEANYHCATILCWAGSVVPLVLQYDWYPTLLCWAVQCLVPQWFHDNINLNHNVEEIISYECDKCNYHSVCYSNFMRHYKKVHGYLLLRDLHVKNVLNVESILKIFQLTLSKLINNIVVINHYFKRLLIHFIWLFIYPLSYIVVHSLHTEILVWIIGWSLIL